MDPEELESIVCPMPHVSKLFSVKLVSEPSSNTCIQHATHPCLAAALILTGLVKKRKKTRLRPLVSVAGLHPPRMNAHTDLMSVAGRYREKKRGLPEVSWRI